MPRSHKAGAVARMLQCGCSPPPPPPPTPHIQLSLHLDDQPCLPGPWRKQAGDLSVLFDVGGVAGGVLAGHLSDRTGASAIVATSFTIASVPFLYFYRAFGHLSFALNVTFMMICGFFVNGPYALITTAVSADLGTHESLQVRCRAGWHGGGQDGSIGGGSPPCHGHTINPQPSHCTPTRSTLRQSHHGQHTFHRRSHPPTLTYALAPTHPHTSMHLQCAPTQPQLPTHSPILL